MTTVGQMASPQPEGDLREHTRVIHLTPTNSFRLTLFTSAGPKTGAASPTFRLGPTLLPPREFLFVPLPLFLSFLTPRRSIFFSTSSASLSGRGLSRFQAPSKIHAQFVAVVSTLVGLPCFAWVCDQWGHRSCAGIHSTADYRRLAPWSCPTDSTLVPPAVSTREAESYDMKRTRSTLSSGCLPFPAVPLHLT